MARLARDDSGSATLNSAIVFPAFLAMIMLVIQAGLYYHASQRTAAAADRAVAVSRWTGASDEQGEEAGRTFLEGELILGGNVDVERPVGSGLVVATATGSVRGPMGVLWSVTSTAAAPLEQFVPENERE